MTIEEVTKLLEEVAADRDLDADGAEGSWRTGYRREAAQLRALAAGLDAHRDDSAAQEIAKAVPLT